MRVKCEAAGFEMDEVRAWAFAGTCLGANSTSPDLISDNHMPFNFTRELDTGD